MTCSFVAIDLVSACLQNRQNLRTMTSLALSRAMFTLHFLLARQAVLLEGAPCGRRSRTIWRLSMYGCLLLSGEQDNPAALPKRRSSGLL